MPQTLESPGGAELIAAWLTLWNGDFSHADQLIASDFRVHAAMLDGTDGSGANGPQGIVGWISQLRAMIPDLHFSIQVGPIHDADHFAVRWSAEGTYAGGFPGAAAPGGTRLAFTGTDILRVKNGLLAEYWVNSDMHVLVGQLQITGG